MAEFDHFMLETRTLVKCDLMEEDIFDNEVNRSTEKSVTKKRYYTKGIGEESGENVRKREQ